MGDLEIVQRFQTLYDDLKEEDEFNVKKPLLAHYTSLAALEKILQTEEIWFSNPLFMNDLEEVRFGLSSGMSRVNSVLHAFKNPSRAAKFSVAFEQCFQSFERDHAFDTYVFCLSEHEAADTDGLLSMWRGYGSNGNGAAIVIDAAQIRVADPSPFIIAKVHYGSGEERIAWLNERLSKFAAIVLASDIPDNKLYLAAQALFQRIKMFALFSKHIGFKEEKEWRIVYAKDRDPNKRLEPMFHYHIGQRGIEPKLRFKVAPLAGVTSDDLSLAKIIERIVLGPSLSSPLAKAAVLRMLDRLEKPYVKDKVYASTIPLRAT